MTNPTNAVWQLDNDLDGQDQSGVVSFTGVDPVRFDSGLWLEQAGTNYGLNTRFANDLSDIDPFSGGSLATLTRDTTDFYVNPASCQVDCAASIDGVILRSDPGAGGTGIPVIGWVIAKIPAGESVETLFQIAYTDASVSNGTPVTWVGTGAYDYYEITRTSDGAKTIDVLKLIPYSSTGAQTFRVGLWQIEKSAYATSYIDGAENGGNGYDFTGTAHRSASTRAASSASVATTGHIAPSSGSLAFRSTRKIDTGAEEIILTVGTVGAATDAMRCGYDATDHPFMEWNSNNAGWQRVTATATVAANVKAFLYFDWTGTTIRCSVDNGALDSDTRDAVEDDWGAGDLTLSAATGGVVFNGFATFSDVLTAEQISTLYARPVWSLGTLDVNTYGRIRSQFELRPY